MRSLNIHERFLRHIWSRQYLEHKALVTLDHLSVHVIEPGTINADGGPDFRNATVRIGGVTYHGDVEIHRTPNDWRLHQHSSDPRYNKVILHVVFERGTNPAPTIASSGRQIPLLILGAFLSESIRTLWHKTVLDEQILAKKSLPCFSRAGSIDPSLIAAWLRRLAAERLELKLRRFDERLRELAGIHLMSAHEGQSRWRVQGNPDDLPPPNRELSQKQLARRAFWDQLLYEGIMEGFGYSKNREPFLRLARSVTLREIQMQGIETDETSVLGFLLGAGGLLPKLNTVEDREARQQARFLLTKWRGCRRLYRSSILHEADWTLFPTRPANFPVHRMTAAAHLAGKILCDDLFRRMVEELRCASHPHAVLRSLRTLLAVEVPSFWKHHYRFGHASPKPLHPLGTERTDAIIANSVIPIALLYARIFRDRLVREGALAIFGVMPLEAGNSITRLMQKQLFRGAFRPASVADQQGAIQLYRFYCSDERCVECDIGRVVFGDAGGTP